MDPTLSCIWITDLRHRDNNGPLIMKLPRIWNARELSVTTPKSPFYPSTVYIYNIYKIKTNTADIDTERFFCNESAKAMSKCSANLPSTSDKQTII